MKRWIQAWAVIAALIASVVLVAQPASATILANFNWDQSPQVGSCGDQSGGFIAAVEFHLQASGAYTDNIDSIYGPNLDAAIRHYKDNHGLNVSGCVGSNMWYDMQLPTRDEGVYSGCAFGGGPTSHHWYYIHNGQINDYFETTGNQNWYADLASGNHVVSPVSYDPYRFSSGLYNFDTNYC